MEIELKEIQIGSSESLLKATDILHDGYVEKSGFSYNESQKSFDIFIERNYWENEAYLKRKTQFFFFEIVKFPIVKTNLHLQNIETFEKNFNFDSIKEYLIFNECFVKKNLFILKFTEGKQIKISFRDKKPFGYLKDMEVVREATFNTIVYPWHLLRNFRKRKKG